MITRNIPLRHELKYFITPAELRVRGRAAQHALAQKVMAAIRALPVTA